MRPAISNPIDWWFRGPRELPILLRGEPRSLREWLENWDTPRLLGYVGVIFLGAGCYGAVTGFWRAPLQALYTGIKLPGILLLTALGNALLNGMLAPLLGLDLRFRQSFQAILMSFAIASAILGSFSPLLWFALWNCPPLDQARGAEGTYGWLLMTQVTMVAFAGIAANLRLLQCLRLLGGSIAQARRILVAWLAGNLFLGSQLAWILRPFVGAPGLPVEFLRPDALQGNFYETVFRVLSRLLF